MNLILASASPRRAEILRNIGAHFTVCPADADESIEPNTAPADAVRELSRRKAFAVLSENAAPDTLVLAADTVVSVDGNIIGKPKDENDAFHILKALSGREHNVFTGYTLCDHETMYTGCEKTAVWFRELTDDEIYRYIKSGEPMDKAGAYGIQEKGAVFVRRIEGDYFNVMGLPISTVCTRAEEIFGVRLADF